MKNIFTIEEENGAFSITHSTDKQLYAASGYSIQDLHDKLDSWYNEVKPKLDIKFGHMYRTRDGREAVCYKEGTVSEYAWVSDKSRNNWSVFKGGSSTYHHSNDDLIEEITK